MEPVAQDVPFVPVYRATYVEQRSRLTTFFRIILAIPHLLLLWAGTIIAVIFGVIGWFAALITGRLPATIARFLTQYLQYLSRVFAYLFLATDAYPPFNFDAPYPISVEVRPGTLNRLAVLFRVFLALPAAILNSIVAGGLYVCSFFIWLYVVVTGRHPRSVWEATIATLRFGMRVNAFWFMLTSAYPSGLFGDDAAGPSYPPPPPPPGMPVTGEELATATTAETELGTEQMTAEPPSETERLTLSRTARRFLILFIVLGLLTNVGVGIASVTQRVTGLVARTEFKEAYDAFGARVNTFGRVVQQCSSEPEPFRCAQDAERDLVGALDDFDAALADIDFPSEAATEVTAMKNASAAFGSSLRALIAADSREEYLRLAQRFQETANGFDAAVNRLGSKLDDVLRGR